MKKNSCIAFAVAVLALAAVGSASADTSRFGKEIRKTELSGYTLTYTLIDVPAMNVTSAMPMNSYDGGYNPSHHLMLFVTGPGGRAVRDIDVGYVVTQPGGAGSRYAASRMDGGAGSDVNLPVRGEYSISTKIALRDADLADSFVYKIQ